LAEVELHAVMAHHLVDALHRLHQRLLALLDLVGRGLGQRAAGRGEGGVKDTFDLLAGRQPLEGVCWKTRWWHRIGESSWPVPCYEQPRRSRRPGRRLSNTSPWLSAVSGRAFVLSRAKARMSGRNGLPVSLVTPCLLGGVEPL